MAKKSNKTSHVLNLITRSSHSEETDEQPELHNPAVTLPENSADTQSEVQKPAPLSAVQSADMQTNAPMFTNEPVNQTNAQTLTNDPVDVQTNAPTFTAQSADVQANAPTFTNDSVDAQTDAPTFTNNPADVQINAPTFTVDSADAQTYGQNLAAHDDAAIKMQTPDEPLQPAPQAAPAPHPQTATPAQPTPFAPQTTPAQPSQTAPPAQPQTFAPQTQPAQPPQTATPAPQTAPSSSLFDSRLSVSEQIMDNPDLVYGHSTATPSHTQMAVPDRQDSSFKNTQKKDSTQKDAVSEKIHNSLERFLHNELSGGAEDASSHIYVENSSGVQYSSWNGRGMTMSNKDSQSQYDLNSLGTEFSHSTMDSVDSDKNSGTSSDFQDADNNYIFVNVAEEIVRSKVPELMKELGMCTCNRCTNDVVAIALNRIPPRYVVTLKGKLYARINACLPQYQTDLVTAITEACQIVKNNSRHTPN